MSLKLKINNVKGYAGVVSVQSDAKGVPLDKFWRKRLADAKHDNCVEIVKQSRAKKRAAK